MNKTNLKKAPTILVIITISIIIIGLICGLSISGYIIIAKLTTPILEENTLGYISYDYNPTLGYTIYIREDNKYVPYLVLTYNYNNTNNALCLRENVVGGSKYIEDYNGTIAKDKIYDGWLEMPSDTKYQDTDVDKYLTGEFLKRFDTKLLNKICNTELSFSEYDYQNARYHTYEINRQFFILSLTELNYSGIDYDNTINNKTKLKYFNGNNLMAFNDNGIESPYWTRSSYSSYKYYMVGYTGGITTTGSNAKFGVRPAFTISNDTKITKIYEQTLMQDIYVLDI